MTRPQRRAGAAIAVGVLGVLVGAAAWALAYVPVALLLAPASMVALMAGVAFWDDHSCGRCAPPVAAGRALVADRFRWWARWGEEWTAVVAATAAAVVLVAATVTGFVPYHQAPTVALATWAWVAGVGAAMAGGHEWGCRNPQHTMP